MAAPAVIDVGLVVRRVHRQGGTEGYVANLAAGLVERGHRVTLYVGELDARAVPDEVRVVRLPGGRQGRRGLLRFAWAARVAREGGHDVVQGFGRTVHHDLFRAGGGCHRTWLRLRGRRPGAWDRLEQRLDHAALQGASIVVCNSEMAARDVVRDAAVAPERVRVVRNGVDLERFRPSSALRSTARRRYGTADEGRVALFLGHGFERKGLAVAVGAFERCAGALDQLWVAGGDRRSRRWKARVEARLGARLVWLGPTDRPEELLPAADAVIGPTRYDPAANTTLEGLACGVPVVTSARDGNHEVVPESSWVVQDPADVSGFAAALDLAWSAPSGEACRAAAEDWPVSRNVDTMDTIYRQWLDGRGA